MGQTLDQVVVRVLRLVLAVNDKESPQGRRDGRVYVYEHGRPLALMLLLVNRFSQTSAISIPFERLAVLSDRQLRRQSHLPLNPLRLRSL